MDSLLFGHRGAWNRVSRARAGFLHPAKPFIADPLRRIILHDAPRSKSQAKVERKLHSHTAKVERKLHSQTKLLIYSSGTGEKE